MVIEPPGAIPGQFIPWPGLAPLVKIERAGALQRLELAAPSALDRALHELAAGNPIEHGVPVGTDPAAAILDVAGAGVDLLVLGSRVYGPLRRTPLGSVSAAVVRHAPCPVLITPRVDHGD